MGLLQMCTAHAFAASLGMELDERPAFASLQDMKQRVSDTTISGARTDDDRSDTGA
jgi:hypothetical protein